MAVTGDQRRRANDVIRGEVVAGLAEAVAFICEDDAGLCFRPVWLTPGVYDRLRAEGAMISCDLHEPPVYARSAAAA